MNFAEILSRLQQQFGDTDLRVTQDQAGDPFIHIPASRLLEVLRFVQEDPQLAFDCLSNLTGLDAPPDDLEVVYHLFSYSQRHSLTLKVRVTKGQPQIPSVESLYPTANWQEREAYDLLGVIFEGHSDLRRIMLPEDWVGHPLRKDYREAENYHGISTSRPSLLV